MEYIFPGVKSNIMLRFIAVVMDFDLWFMLTWRLFCRNTPFYHLVNRSLTIRIRSRWVYCNTLKTIGLLYKVGFVIRFNQHPLRINPTLCGMDGACFEEGSYPIYTSGWPVNALWFWIYWSLCVTACSTTATSSGFKGLLTM